MSLIVYQMRNKAIIREALLILLLLLLVEGYDLIIDLRTSIIQDWFVVIAPLLWLNISIIYIYVFLRYLFGAMHYPSSPTNKGYLTHFLMPNFGVLNSLVKKRRIKSLWIIIGCIYAVLYMYLQGILVVDMSGNLLPTFSIVDSLVGYGPVVVWIPSITFGLVIRPYTIAAALALSITASLVLAILSSLLTKGRQVIGSFPAPLISLGVVCPTCFISPTMGLLLAYITPATALVSIGIPLFSAILAFSTTLLLISLLLLWIALSLISRMPHALFAASLTGGEK